jgi:hypothetical protein
MPLPVTWGTSRSVTEIAVHGEGIAMPQLTIRHRRFSDGTDLDPVTTLTVVNNSTAMLGAPPNITTGSGPTAQSHAFLFWNVKGAVNTQPSQTISDVGTTALSASAWFIPTGPGGGPGGPPAVGLLTFSIGGDHFLSASPVQSASPAGAVSGTTVDTTGGPVSVNAVDAEAAEAFQAWTLFCAGSAIGDILNLPQDASGLAMASYLEIKNPPHGPDHFHEIVDLVDELSRIRGRFKDWIADPAPEDLLRTVRDIELRQTVAADDITRVIENVRHMDKPELSAVAASLRGEIDRMNGVLKMVEAANKQR